MKSPHKRTLQEVWQKVCSVGGPGWSSSFPKHCSLCYGATLEQSLTNCSLWEAYVGSVPEAYVGSVPDCILWEGLYAVAGEESQEEEAAVTKDYILTVTSFPIPLCCVGSKEVEESRPKLSPGIRAVLGAGVFNFVFISHCPTVFSIDNKAKLVFPKLRLFCPW